MTTEPDSDLAATVAAVTAGQIRAGTRLISRIERGDDGVTPILRALFLHGGHGRVIGVTGPPGAGKSTLINRMVGHWRRQGRSVAVLAIDPSSPFTGGAVLGDRLRMGDHSGDPGVFIRSMASRGQLGGLARAAGDALTVLEAMPWDVVLVETVGVGQNETDVMRHAAVVVLLQTPMGGDDIQAAKAGITEIGDIFVVNKSDHPDAERTARYLEDMLSLSQRLHGNRSWHPPVVRTRAASGAGVEDLAAQIDRCFATFAAHPELARARMAERVRHRVSEILRHQLDRRLKSEASPLLDPLIEPVLARRGDPYAVADELLARMFA
ncbi:methylmalonyl Co-A mutase-associated GTPase MeaB [Sulfuritalea sp.]|uniref:methylmalonyl Co-A mutase-associated GTPase MeaB n=1 Tax=Sulfuritalea sp. TaxID=2480090 RepID=UPI001AD29817|nr:methylmalonyl Co-A mutase-associated GTPase MeaB [Sulfuritalea sp.]MBN8476606.1 methylmalonyl Co-A mutase-associated GTPase MeaB [Sulfuritalea sp.]